MDRQELLDRLDLDDQTIVYQQIEPKAGVQFDVVIDHRQSDLPFHVQSAFGQFMSQADFINAFEQSRS